MPAIICPVVREWPETLAQYCVAALRYDLAQKRDAYERACMSSAVSIGAQMRMGDAAHEAFERLALLVGPVEARRAFSPREAREAMEEALAAHGAASAPAA